MRLVSPGYSEGNLINNLLAPYTDRQIEFKGINRKHVVEEGEMSDMWNLTSDKYPLLTPRRLRGSYTLPADVVRPLKIISRYNKLAMIALDDEDKLSFYFDGVKESSVTGLTSESMMVAINTKICFFPQKTYIEVTKSGSTITVGTFGNLEESFDNSTSGTAITITISNEDARVALETTSAFAYDDGITIKGQLSYTDSGGTSHQGVECDVSAVIEEVDGTTLVLPRETFIEVTGEGATSISFRGAIERTMPVMDHIIEWNNRLWGANSRDNTIYACKLGDPKNWQYFQGTSLDSYYAQQGTDGDWTGCAEYSSHLIFFKESSMCRIYGTAPSNYQITNTACYGVEEGSHRSAITINDKVFYKSAIGIMAYDGGVPYCISEKFNKTFRNVVAGTEGTKYYASIQDDLGYELFVLDIDKAVWHKEDATRFRNTCTVNNRLYYIEYSDDLLTCETDLMCSEWLICGDSDVTGTIGISNPENASETYDGLPWRAVFGPFDEYIENRKIYSKLSMRFNAVGEASVNVYISLNDGPWELVKAFDSVRTGGELIPIVPRRCDRYSIKVEGTGNTEIKSLTRRYRAGTERKL